MPYCTTNDLLIGQLISRTPPEVVPGDYVNRAADEMDSRLGFVYQTPLPVTGINALPSHQVKLLKSINLKLASGRIILATTIATEDVTIHQYGLRLIQEADLELAAIANGDVKLSAPMVDSDGVVIGEIVDPDDADPYARVPTAINVDMYSAVVAFEANVHQGQAVNWAPRDGTRTTYYYPPRRSGG
jgi:hypothetical protein